MVWTSYLDHLKGQLFHPVVVFITKSHFQFDLADWISRLTGYHTMEDSILLAEVLIN